MQLAEHARAAGCISAQSQVLKHKYVAKNFEKGKTTLQIFQINCSILDLIMFQPIN
jgi:hypothetical protein